MLLMCAVGHISAMLILDIIHRCEAMGLAETNPGTHSSDSECGNPPTAVAIIASSVIVTLILITVVSVLIFKHFRKKKLSKSSGKLYSFIFVV